jgi:hypothetical protein
MTAWSTQAKAWLENGASDATKLTPIQSSHHQSGNSEKRKEPRNQTTVGYANPAENFLLPSKTINGSVP